MPESIHPPTLWIGLGCRSGISQVDLATAIQQVCQRYGLVEARIAGVATLQIKLSEAGLVRLCTERGWPLYGFSAERLAQVQVPYPSDRVAAKVGISSVAEAAALLAAPQGYLLVPKQIIRAGDSVSAVTIAVACTTEHQMVVQ
jgi:cobalamin biosynthesis protein CbiG